MVEKKIDFSPIAPVATGVQRPLWSVMIPVYNRIDYLEQAIESVLCQDLGSELMQIEVVDNCSTESDPQSIIEKLFKGRVSYYRQPNNVGMINNMMTCINRSRGHFVHILHDDDFVLPGFYATLQKAFEQDQSIGMAFCRSSHVNEHNQIIHENRPLQDVSGIIPDWLDKIALGNLVEPPDVAVRRSVYEHLGGYSCLYFDWEMWIRIASHYAVWYTPQSLSRYRVHTSSETSNQLKAGTNVLETLKVIEISESYLPQEKCLSLSRKSKQNFALYALAIARRALVWGDLETATSQIRGAFKASFSLKVIATFVMLPLSVLLGFCKRYLFAESSPNIR